MKGETAAELCRELGMKRPAQVYKTSPRKMPTVANAVDPEHAVVLRVVELRQWLVTFAKLDLGHVDVTGFTPL